MCAKQLYVKSNGQWVAALGGGSVVADGLATEQFVTDAIAAIPATDLSGLATLTDLNDALAAIQPGDPDFSNYYVKEDVNALIAGLAARIDPDQVLVADSVYSSSFNFGAFPLPDAQLKYLDDGEGKGERLSVTDRATGTSKYVAYLSDIVAPTPVDLSPYTKLADNTQNVVANALLAKGYAFGDAVGPNNPGLVYTDTGEGYGPRLVLDTPAGVELIPYQSDFEPIKARLTTLEGKTAPTVDLSPYITQVDADARYGARNAEAVSLLQGQLQTIFDSIYTRPEADDRYAERAKTYTKTECDTKFLTTVDIARFPFRDDVYTQKQCEDRFIRIENAFSKIDFDNQMVLTLYSRKQIDDKLIAINPIASPSINDPALADFKKSVLDEVKRLMAGGKTVPADVAWTKLLNAGTAANAPEAKVLNGIVYMRGEAVKQGGAGYTANAYQLPPTIPAPPREMVVPLAMKNTNPAGRYYGYATIQTNRQIGVSCDNAFNTVWFDGISYPAYE